MPDPLQIPRITNNRTSRRHKRDHSLAARLSRFGLGFAAVLSVLLIAAVVWVSFIYSQFSSDLPSIDALPVLLDGSEGQFQQPTRIYARDGQTLLLTLANPNAEDAVYLPLKDIPQHMQDATLAASDPDFWQHHGFHLQIDGRQLTLAQRLVQELLLWGENGKDGYDLRLSLLAAQATSKYGRQSILEWYLNSADYGQMAYGVDEAARVYFGKPATDLTLAEAAMLAATAEAPALNPIDAPDIAIQRQGAVLQTMLGLGFISTEEALNANASPIQVQSRATHTESAAPEFADYLLAQLYALFGHSRVARGGLVVVSSLDMDLQQEAQCAVQVQLARLHGEIPLSQLGDNDCEAARLLPTMNANQVSTAPDIEAGVVVLEPSTGQILAMIGDPLQGHTPGSVLTPFVYLTAFTRGLSPAGLVWDIPGSLPPGLGDVENSDGEFHGPMRIRTALANDYLVPALSTLMQMGPTNVWRTAQQSGLASLPLYYDNMAYRLLLDAGDVDLLEVTQAYNMLGNQGKLVGQPFSPMQGAPISSYTIDKVRDSSGRTLLDWSQPQLQAVVSPQLAYLVTDVLSDELARQPAYGHPNILEIGRPAAVKTGQSTSRDSVWTVGYTPQYTIGVWVGLPQPHNNAETEISPLAAAGLWHALMKSALIDQAPIAWEESLGISHVNVCDPSGLLPTADCPNVVEEVFLSGTEPQQEDNLYKTYLVNRQTGRLATVHTPSEFVDEQVFLDVPPEALEWARQAGLAVPPEDYDVIFNPVEGLGPVAITSPQMFDYISGIVEVMGRANLEGMQYYRLQIGEGLYPRQWLQIGNDISSLVEDGLLVTWDTTGLDGLYAVQLLVVAQDQSVQETTIQVTVDNIKPVVEITLPSAGQVIASSEARSLTFQAQVTDNIGVAQVEFYLDGGKLSQLTETPYAVPWQGTVGEHELRVVATDLAGNRGETSVKFNVTQ
jgi:membrane peptidoglycan carboxypeptidase